MTTENEKTECGWVRLFHPASVQVTIPLFLDNPITEAMAETLLVSISRLIAAGFAVQAPGPENSEYSEEIGFVVRRSKRNTDGTETPVVDLYPTHGNFRHLGKYLNSESDIREFEAACSLRLDSIPRYDGDNPIERGKNPKMDKYVVAIDQPVNIVWKSNPRYEGDTDKRNPKRLFVRWATVNGSRQLPPTLSSDEARAVACPLGTKSHPEFKGLLLGEIATKEDGRKILEYLVSEQFCPNGDREGHKAKAAAKVLLASLQPA